MPRVSVLMSVYNCERYIAASVESILRQSFDDFEFLVVDDGSTDRTAEILAGYRDPRLRVLQQKNAGVPAAINKAFEHASGDLIARMDADDIALPHRLDLQVAYMERHPDCTMLGSSVYVLCPAGLPLYEKVLETEHDAISHRIWAGDSQAIMQPVLMIRREAFETVGGYRNEYALIEDIDLYLRVLPLGRCANLREPLLGYRQHPQSVNAVNYHKQLSLMRELFKELESACPYPGMQRPILNGWERPTPGQFLRRCGNNAVRMKEFGLARHYLAKALRHEPMAKEAWRLFYDLSRSAAAAMVRQGRLTKSRWELALDLARGRHTAEAPLEAVLPGAIPDGDPVSESPAAERA